MRSPSGTPARSCTPHPKLLPVAHRLAAEQRLPIPLLVADDGIHGHSFWPGATIFGTQLAMACSWDASLVEASARITASEMAATGMHWTFLAGAVHQPRPALGTGERDLR